MIAGITCTVIIAAIAVWQTLSLRAARAVGAVMLVELARREAVIDKLAVQLTANRKATRAMLALVSGLHQAALANDAAAMLELLAQANAEIGSPP